MEFFKNTRELLYKRVREQCLFTQGALRASGKIKVSKKPDYSERRQHTVAVFQMETFFSPVCA